MSEEEHPKLKLLLIAILVASLLVGAGVAVTSWTQQIVWEWQNANPQFELTGESESLDLGVIVQGVNQMQTKTYMVYNTGNVPITVAPSTNSGEGFTASWDKENATIPEGDSTTFTLTLNITGAGSCTVAFNKV